MTHTDRVNNVTMEAGQLRQWSPTVIIRLPETVDYRYEELSGSYPMVNPALQYPIFGPEIQCPHCRQEIPALTLTDTYLCPRHGAFEANPDNKELVHLQSGRHWRQWEGEWYRQHTHPDGIRFEIHEALDRLYTQGYGPRG
ncbi:hypothetical protein XM38_041310 [Halomicronema hongdechloris C2206]|uniref:Uncharacterized protein n=1 Tax=Halomicronema hongdechloris C2206 TaxID=1641165 RepID=A0A1Z3HS92_9CYAN|nr:hypothetical protein XM38_041310 [Halomicronema hongdechloris C2206]